MFLEGNTFPQATDKKCLWMISECMRKENFYGHFGK